MIIVTGGSGFLGSHLLYYLSQDNEKIVAIKRPESSMDTVCKVFDWLSDDPESQLQRIHWVDGNLFDMEFLEKHIDGDTVFYHCAAIVSFQKKDRERLLLHNARVTENIVNACLKKKAKKLCHVSSIAALGRAKKGKECSEKDYFSFGQKPSQYGISKFLAEQHVWRGQAEGLSTVIVNPSVILGVGDWTKGSAKLIRTVWKGLKFYTQGVNGYIDARDVAQTMIRLTNSTIENQRFVLNSENISYKTLFDTIAKGLKVPPPPYKANKFLSSIAWRVVKLWSILSRQEAFITKETARTANRVYRYNSDKIRNTLDIDFIPVKNSIQDSCERFLYEQNQK